jgi:hypothetical protein
MRDTARVEYRPISRAIDLPRAASGTSIAATNARGLIRRAARHGRGVVVLALVCLPAFLAAPAQADPEIGGSVPALDALESQGVALLNAHLSPGLTIDVKIGWYTNAPSSERSPAVTNQVVQTSTSNLTGKTTVTHYCQIAVNEPLFDAYTGAGWQEAIITHELFHCYQIQLLPDAFGTAASTEKWMIEGLARWVDLTLFASNPVPAALNDLESYFKNSTVPLFGRGYDAVGFWGHLDDVSGGDLWSRIPAIIRAGANGSQATVDVALGSDKEKFLDSWGTSAVNRSEGGASWTATSPGGLASSYSAAAHTIGASNPSDSSVSVKLEPYSTAQLMVAMPAPPAGEIETAKIDMGGAYGRFGVLDNYTPDELKNLTFCSASACTPTPTPQECPGGATPTPAPTGLTPLPEDALLGAAAGDSSETVTVTYTPLSTTPDGGTCPPTPGNNGGGDGGDNSGSGGDPHFTDFHGDLFDFQASGEYTLLQSTTDNLQIQVRQQQIGHTGVAVNTETAVSDGKAIVEIDATGVNRITAYVNHHRIGSGRHSLSGGGSLVVNSPLATVRWADGTTVKIDNAVNGPSFKHLVADLWLDITVAAGRRGALTGLLGDAGVPEQTEFASRGGTVYSASQIIGSDASILYGAFGKSWRITSKKASLFHSNKPSDLHAATIGKPGGILALLLKLLDSHPAHVQQAAKACNKHQFGNGAALDACEVDVAETGNTGFVAADQALGQESAADVAADTPPPAPPAPPPPVPTAPALPAAISLGAGSDAPRIAYSATSGDTYVAWESDTDHGVYECTVLSGATGCNGGGPELLPDPVATEGGDVPDFFGVQVTVLNGEPVVVAEVDGANAAVEGSYSSPEGVLAWSASSAGGTLSADDSGKLLADAPTGDGDMPSAGAVALGSANVAVAGNEAQFGTGFSDFTLATPSSGTPTIDRTTPTYGDQAFTDGSQLAVVADGGSNYLAVVVGGASTSSPPPPGCTTGSVDETGFGAAVGTAASLNTQAVWGTGYFTDISCDAEGPALAGGPSGIGVLESEGPGLLGSGSDGVYYRTFSATTKLFSASPTLVSDETLNTLSGAESLSVSQDSTGGIYASWSDGRGVTLSYSSNGGANWTMPFGSGLGNTSPVGDPVVAGVGSATAEIAYDAGDTEKLQVVPAADINFVP